MAPQRLGNGVSVLHVYCCAVAISSTIDPGQPSITLSSYTKAYVVADGSAAAFSDPVTIHVLCCPAGELLMGDLMYDSYDEEVFEVRKQLPVTHWFCRAPRASTSMAPH